MAVRIVRLGSPRADGEGVRLGTVRRPPRGVPKTRWVADDWFDVWLPELSPAAETVKAAQQATDTREWRAFERRYRREMAAPASAHLLDLLAAVSHGSDFAVGCYCEDEARCHRAVLRALLVERGAVVR